MPNYVSAAKLYTYFENTKFWSDFLKKERGANRCGWLPIDFRLFRVQSNLSPYHTVSHGVCPPVRLSSSYNSKTDACQADNLTDTTTKFLGGSENVVLTFTTIELYICRSTEPIS